jgi:phage tail sheath protein FI
MRGLFRLGAFHGPTAQHTHFVKCDATTTTPSDLSQGVVNILVGFAPLKPAEFVVLRLSVRAASPVS